VSLGDSHGTQASGKYFSSIDTDFAATLKESDLGFAMATGFFFLKELNKNIRNVLYVKHF